MSKVAQPVASLSIDLGFSDICTVDQALVQVFRRCNCDSLVKPAHGAQESSRGSSFVSGYQQAGAVEALCLAGNRIHEIPSLGRFLHRFPGLKQLELSGNGLAKIAVHDGSSFPQSFKLRELLLACNRLQAADLENLVILRTLTILDLSKNAISFLPSTWGRVNSDPTNAKSPFPALEKLNLSSNKLFNYNCLLTLSKLPALQQLNLSCNYIKQIPDEVSFTRLQELDLSNNLIETELSFFPLMRCDSLRLLILVENPVLSQKSHYLGSSATSLLADEALIEAVETLEGKCRGKSRATQQGMVPTCKSIINVVDTSFEVDTVATRTKQQQAKGNPMAWVRHSLRATASRSHRRRSFTRYGKLFADPPRVITSENDPQLFKRNTSTAVSNSKQRGPNGTEMIQPLQRRRYAKLTVSRCNKYRTKQR